MSINSLYDSWSDRIRQLFPGLRITQHRNLVWLLVGIYRSKSIHLSKIAGAECVNGLRQHILEFSEDSMCVD